MLYFHVLVEHGSAAFTSIVASINSILNISKKLLVPTLTDHVPLNGWLLLRQPIKADTGLAPMPSHGDD